ncbi:MAG: PHP domain-containing protein [Geosporobacter ferrireducens]|nr:PHP domain-containing protein [Geosporobacter ferrireducens]
MKAYYDLHIHTALSPCGDKDMTPNNIINMSVIKGLNVIAITDHNSIDNCRACIRVGEKNGILVIPAMELQTKEEIHLLCLFKNLSMLENFHEIILGKLGTQENLPDFFGRQLIFDEQDCIVGENHRLLITSAAITLEEAVEKISNLGGIAVPAHINKGAYSIITNLGFIPEHLPINTIELTKKTDIQSFQTKHPNLKNYNIIQDSDAHYLWEISEREHYLEVGELAIDEIFSVLSQNNNTVR